MHSLKNGQSWPLELHKQAPLKGFTSLPLIVAISLQHFIDNEFELGIKKAIKDEKKFNFTSNLELSLEEAVQAASQALAKQLEKMPDFEITQDNKYRWEAKQVKIEGDTTIEQILSYRYPMDKKSGAQVGLLIGNVEYKIESDKKTKPDIKANLHIVIKSKENDEQ